MKISFIEPHLKLFGGIRRVLELSNNLISQGNSVTIFHSDGSACRWMETQATIKRHEDVLLQNHEVLIFNDPNPVDFQLARQAKAKLKVFYVLALYETDLLNGFNIRLLRPKNRRTLFMHACLHSPYLKLANATWLVEWLKNNLNIESKLLLGGVNQAMFYPVPVVKNPEEIRVLYSGDPRPRKGTKTVLEAVRIAQRQEPQLVLDTYHGEEIPQEQMATKYSSADIFIDGQIQGGWNNPVAEAMACKVPVVCTDIGAVQDFAINEKTALVVPIEESIAMAEAILRLARDVNLRQSLSEKAYQKIIQFDWEKSATKLEKILSSALDEESARWSNSNLYHKGIDVRILIQLLRLTKKLPFPKKNK